VVVGELGAADEGLWSMEVAQIVSGEAGMQAPNMLAGSMVLANVIEDTVAARSSTESFVSDE
jgi:hypothetical protein